MPIYLTRLMPLFIKDIGHCRLIGIDLSSRGLRRRVLGSETMVEIRFSRLNCILFFHVLVAGVE